MLNIAEQCWTLKTELFCNCIFPEVFLRSFPQKFAKRRVSLRGLAPLVCYCQHWKTTGNNLKFSSITSKPYIPSDSWRWKISGQVNITSSTQPHRFLLLMQKKCFLLSTQKTSYSSDEIGVWGVSRYWRNAFYVPGQVALDHPNPILFCRQLTLSQIT